MSTGLTKLILDDSNAFAVKLLAERAKRQFLSAAFIGVLCFCDPGEHATSLGLRDHTIKLQSYNHDTLMIRWWYHHADAYKCRSGWVISDSLIVSSPSECDSVASSYHCLKGRAGPNRSKLMQVRPSGCVVIDGKKSWKKTESLDVLWSEVHWNPGMSFFEVHFFLPQWSRDDFETFPRMTDAVLTRLSHPKILWAPSRAPGSENSKGPRRDVKRARNHRICELLN